MGLLIGKINIHGKCCIFFKKKILNIWVFTFSNSFLSFFCLVFLFFQPCASPHILIPWKLVVSQTQNPMIEAASIWFRKVQIYFRKIEKQSGGMAGKWVTAKCKMCSKLHQHIGNTIEQISSLHTQISSCTIISLEATQLAMTRNKLLVFSITWLDSQKGDFARPVLFHYNSQSLYPWIGNL